MQTAQWCCIIFFSFDLFRHLIFSQIVEVGQNKNHTPWSLQAKANAREKEKKYDIAFFQSFSFLKKSICLNIQFSTQVKLVSYKIILQYVDLI